MKQLILLGIILMPTISFAQNNPIFYGGIGQGSIINNYNQEGNQIIFNGGTNDGISVNTYNQSGNTIMFNGGSNDGVSIQNYEQGGNSIIFNGGNSDGASTQSFKQSETYNIYTGGQGDGWANIIMPLSPLPIELLDFNANKIDDIHLIKWKLSNDEKIKNFEVEWSNNAIDFKPIGSVAYHNGVSDYHLQSKNYSIGSNFYRLKIIDNDLNIKYSNVVEILESDNINIALFPNPTSTEINIKLSGIKEERTTIEILTINGQIKTVEHFESNLVCKIDVSKFIAGTYILRIKSNKRIYLNQFIKL